MLIVKILAENNGAHASNLINGKIGVPDGYAAVREDLEQKALSLLPWVRLTVADGIITAIEDDVAARAVFEALPKPEPEPTTEEVLSQTVANLTLENFDLKNQMQTLAQTVTMMQIGGRA